MAADEREAEAEAEVKGQRRIGESDSEFESSRLISLLRGTNGMAAALLDDAAAEMTVCEALTWALSIRVESRQSRGG